MCGDVGVEAPPRTGESVPELGELPLLNAKAGCWALQRMMRLHCSTPLKGRYFASKPWPSETR